MKFGPWLFACALAMSATGANAMDDSLLLSLSVDGETLRIETYGETKQLISVPLAEARTEQDGFHLGPDFRVTGDTIHVGERAIPFQRLGALGVERQSGRVRVNLYDRGVNAPRTVRSANVVEAKGDVKIDSGRFVRGFVLGFGGGVDVAGEVNRSVVAVAGDVTVQAGGVVRGSVVALGGDIHKPDEAFVYGDLYADNRQKFQPHWYEDPNQSPVDFSVAFDYNRVTGGLAWAGAEVGPRSGWAPRLAVSAGYAFWPELWHYRIGLKRESVEGPLYSLGFHRDTKDDDASIISRNENTIFALLFGLDYRDYYFAQGFSTSAGWAFSERRRASLTYVNEELTELSAHTEQWSLFNGGSFQENYETILRTGDTTFHADFEGRLTFLKAEVAWELPAWASRREGVWGLSLACEVSDDDLGSDFDYTRYGGRLMRVQPTWRRQELRARLAGTASGGQLPATRQLYLGGIGSLRGFDHKEFLGEAAWCLNLEYGWDWGNVEIFALYDAGQIDPPGSAGAPTVLHDVGLGVQIQRTFRVQVACDARFERPPLVTVRFAKAP